MVTTKIKIGRMNLAPFFRTSFDPKNPPIICPAAIVKPTLNETLPKNKKHTRETRLLFKLRTFVYAVALDRLYPRK